MVPCPSPRPRRPLAAGSYSFLASYSGDANYASSIGSCEPLTVKSAPTPTPTSDPDDHADTLSQRWSSGGHHAGHRSRLRAAGSAWLGLLLLTLGGAVLIATGLIRRTDGAIENI